MDNPCTFILIMYQLGMANWPCAKFLHAHVSAYKRSINTVRTCGASAWSSLVSNVLHLRRFTTFFPFKLTETRRETNKEPKWAIHPFLIFSQPLQAVTSHKHSSLTTRYHLFCCQPLGLSSSTSISTWMSWNKKHQHTCVPSEIQKIDFGHSVSLTWCPVTFFCIFIQ